MKLLYKHNCVHHAIIIVTFFVCTINVSAKAWLRTGDRHFDFATLNTSTNGWYAYKFIGGAHVSLSVFDTATVAYYTLESGSAVSTRGTADFHKTEELQFCNNFDDDDPPTKYYPGGDFEDFADEAESSYIAGDPSSGGSIEYDEFSGSGYVGYIYEGSYFTTDSDSGSCTPMHSGYMWGKWYHVYIEWDAGATLPSFGTSASIGGGLWQVKPSITIEREYDGSDNPYNVSGEFRIRRCDATSNSSPLTVYFTVSGTATEGTDYTVVGTSVTIPANQESAIIEVNPYGPDPGDGPETVIITIDSNSNYYLGYDGTTCAPSEDEEATVTIYNN